MARRPVIATHSSAFELRGHHRNLTDERLKDIRLEGPGGLPLVTEELLRPGVVRERHLRVLGGNDLRLFRAELGVPLAERG